MKLRREKYAKRLNHYEIGGITAFFAGIIILLTLAVLVLPAIALSTKNTVMDCPVMVHEHKKSCYQIDENGNEVLVCGLADSLVHTHDENCYDAEGNLICSLPEVREHIHDERCYEEQRILVCNLEENEDHIHNDECYETEKVLICKENELHTHDDSCCDESGNLICGKVELRAHQHDASCMREEEVSEPDEESAEMSAADSPAFSDGENEPPSDADVTEGLKEETEEAGQSDNQGANDETGNNDFCIFEESTDTVTVHVEAAPDAFPEGVTMSVKEIDDEETVQAISDAVEGKVKGIRAVDITFSDKDGNEIEPVKPIRVSMSARLSKEEKKADLTVVHVDDQGEVSQLEEVAVETEKKETVTSFEADQFSVYAVVYTVDFHWEVDGQEYEFSISGGDSVSFSQLIDALHILDEKKDEEVGEFLSDIDDIRFSAPELVWAGKLEENMTAGQIVKKNDLEVEYSGELTTEQIKELANKSYKAGEWVLMGLKAFDTEEELTITMKNGDIWTIRVTDVKDPLGLDDRTVAFVVKTGDSTGTSVQDQLLYNHDLVGRQGEYALTGGVEYCSEEATAWLFEYDPDQEAYYISNGYHTDDSIRYLTLHTTAAGGLDADRVTLEASKENAAPMKIERNTDGTYRLYIDVDGNRRYLTYNSNQNFHSFYGSANGPGTDIHFCLPELGTGNDSHKATMISAQDLQPGQSVVIYQRVKQPNNTFVYYAIADDPSTASKAAPFKVWNSSDSVYWKGNPSILWRFTEATDADGQPNGYYYFINEATGRYLAAKADGTLIQDLNDPAFNDLSRVVKREDHVQIALPGVRTGSYTSKIANWDYGVSVTSAPKMNDSNKDGVPETITGEDLMDSQEFYFAVRDPIVQKQLTEVDTVDSISKGIKITMYDFSSSCESTWSRNHPNYGKRLPYMNYIIGTPQWDAAKYYPGSIVSPTLATDNNNGNMEGFPNTYPSGNSYYWTQSTGDVRISEGGHSLGLVFYPEENAMCDYTSEETKNVNHLFIQSVYDATGYFRYSSFENFARLNTETGNFKVYEQIGTPAAESYMNDYNSYYMNRGNFMPYNDLDLTSPKVNNYESSSDNPLDNSHPRKGEDLYFLQGRPKTSSDSDSRDYYFGMIMEATFQQDKDGINERGDPVRYEFNGDDDLWVYIDGVLVLDIGGVHDAFQGYIDFNTGDVEVYPVNASVQRGEKTTIKRKFFDAGQFPDGTPWDNSNEANYNIALADEYFDGETLKDYSSHDFKMFYMERGAGASNLDLQFNLTTLTQDQFRVTKEMPETETGHDVQVDYGNTAFYYRAHKVERVYNGQTNQYEDVESVIRKTDIFKDNVTYEQAATYEDGESPLVWHTDDIFEVRPGHSAIIPVVNHGVRYYVEEVEPDQPEGEDPGSNMLDNFYVTNTSPEENQPENKQFASDVKTVQQRSEVIYTNKPDDGLVNELRITKKLHGSMLTGADGSPLLSAVGSQYFEYAIYLEDNDGKMVPYSIGPYYVIDKYGRFVYYTKTDNKRHYYGFEKNADGTYSYYNVSPSVEGPGSEEVPELGSLVETTRNPKVTEYTGEEGYLGDVRDGDTLVIVGLVEGTHFIVDEICYGPNDFLTLNEEEEAYLSGNKYLFEKTEVNEYVHVSGENLPYDDHVTGHLFNEVDKSEVSVSAKAAEGNIRLDNDTEVKVHNRSKANRLPILVKKNWSGIDADDPALAGTQVKVTLGRYILKDKAGTLTVKKTGVPAGVNYTATYTVKNSGGKVIANIPYRSGVGSENGVTISVPEGIYTVTETIRSQDEDYRWNHDPSNAAGSSATITTDRIDDSGSAAATFACQPELKSGSLRVSSSYTIPPGGSVDFSGVTYTVYEGDENSTTRACYPGGTEIPVITFEQANAQGGYLVEGLKIGTYTVKENGVPINAGDYTLTDHVPAGQWHVTKTVGENQQEEASFRSEYTLARTNINYFIGKPATWSMTERISGTNNSFAVGKTVKLTFYCSGTWDRIDNCKSQMSEAELLTYGGDSLTYTHSNVNGNSKYEITFTVKQNADLRVYVNANPNNSSEFWGLNWEEVPGVQSLSFSPLRSLLMNGSLPLLGADSNSGGDENSDSGNESPSGNAALGTGSSGIDYGDTPTPPEGRKYVVDNTFTMQNPENPDEQVPYYIILTQDDYNEDAGGWIQNLADLPEHDEDGNKYYYYIASIEETGAPGGTITTVKLDGEDTFIVGKDKHMTVDNTTTPPTLTPDPLEVFNEVVSEVNVTIHKVDKANLTAGTPLLPGAKFKLIKYSAISPNKVKDMTWDESVVSETPGSPGVFSFTGLGAGYYEIVETQSPEGYIRSTDNPIIMIRANSETHELEAVLVYTSGQNIGQPISGNKTDLVEVDHDTVTVGNEPGAALPNTGGAGTRVLYLLGLILAGLAAAGLAARWKMQQNES